MWSAPLSRQIVHGFNRAERAKPLDEAQWRARRDPQGRRLLDVVTLHVIIWQDTTQVFLASEDLPRSTQHCSEMRI